MEIVPLTEKTLNRTVKLVTKIFPPEYEEEPGTEELPASLNPEAHRQFLDKTQMTFLQYWTAVDGRRVAGSVGLYCYKDDEHEADWLGWYCVDERYRQNGLGTKLLLFAINKAKERGKDYLRLYTTDDEDELDAHRLFEKYGFKVVGQKPWGGAPELGLTEFFYELNLKAQA